MKVLFLLPRSARGGLLAALLVSLVGGLAGGLAVAVLNRALGAGQAALPALGAWFIAASVGMWAARVWSHTRFVRFSQDVLVQLRLHVSRHFASVPYRELEALGSARMLAILLEDVRVAAEVLVTVPRLAMQAAAILAGLAHLAYLSWSAFAFTVILIVMGSLAHVALEKRAARFLRGARRAEDGLYEHLRGLVAGAKELKLNAARRNVFLEQVLSPSIADVRAQRTCGLSMHAVAGSFGAFLFFAVIGAVTFLGGALHESSAVRSGYALTLLFLMHPIEGLLEMVPTFSRARIAFERIADSGVQLYAPPTRDLGAEPARARHAPPPRVVLRDVTHRYRRESEDGVFVVGPIRLELVPGETVFVIGGNGSGKTTLAKLLVGLYTPEAGRVLVDGHPSNAVSLAGYGEYFSAIFSDYHLFRELLETDAEGADRARHWLAELDLDHKVSITGGRFSTTELSSGQRKRLALVALLLEDRPICVFDEWAADQDPAYKRAFYCELLPALKARGKTLFVITHDERYFYLADRCIMLEAGKIVGSYSPSRRATSRASTATY